MMGVAWASGGATEQSRRAANRALEELAEGGLIVARRPRVKTLSARLTDEGLARANLLCGLPDRLHGWLSLKEVAERSRRKPRLIEHKWASECRLTGTRRPDGDDLWAVQSLALPALVCGWLSSNADTQGRVYYAVTPAGWEAIDAGQEPPGPEDVGEPAPGAWEAYREALEHAQARLLRGDRVDPKCIGWVPLPVAHKGHTLDCW